MKPPSPFNGLLQIPIDWTPEQARAVLEILGNLEEEIWALYGDDIMALIKSQRSTAPSTSDAGKSETNLFDDLPF